MFVNPAETRYCLRQLKGEPPVISSEGLNAEDLLRDVRIDEESQVEKKGQVLDF